jgi:hypothetical protein
MGEGGKWDGIGFSDLEIMEMFFWSDLEMMIEEVLEIQFAILDFVIWYGFWMLRVGKG